MGDRTTISGHIQEPWYVVGTRDNEDQQLQLLETLNAAVLKELPELDREPPLVRSMFTFSGPENSQCTYRGRVIHFGGSYHALWTEWAEWLQKFENLLRRLHWEHATLTMVTEYQGTHHYFWNAAEEAMLSLGGDPPRPIDRWTFSGGPRAFE